MARCMPNHAEASRNIWGLGCEICSFCTESYSTSLMLCIYKIGRSQFSPSVLKRNRVKLHFTKLAVLGYQAAVRHPRGESRDSSEMGREG